MRKNRDRINIVRRHSRRLVRRSYGVELRPVLMVQSPDARFSGKAPRKESNGHSPRRSDHNRLTSANNHRLTRRSVRPEMPHYVLLVNGTEHRVAGDPDMPLLWALRDLLRLTGTKYGCGMGACGACTVHENGIAVRSCQIPLSATDGKRYVTIEGLSPAGSHPCQLAWIEEDVAQCGYCQAGMIMEAAALLVNKPDPTDHDIEACFGSHVCRCGTFQRLRRAIHAAARKGKS